MPGGPGPRSGLTPQVRARDYLGLHPGTVVEFRAEEGRLVGIKAVATDVFRKWRGRGRLPHGLSVDRDLRRSRGSGAHGR